MREKGTQSQKYTLNLQARKPYTGVQSGEETPARHLASSEIHSTIGGVKIKFETR